MKTTMKLESMFPRNWRLKTFSSFQFNYYPLFDQQTSVWSKKTNRLSFFSLWFLKLVVEKKVKKKLWKKNFKSFHKFLLSAKMAAQHENHFSIWFTLKRKFHITHIFPAESNRAKKKTSLFRIAEKLFSFLFTGEEKKVN